MLQKLPTKKETLIHLELDKAIESLCFTDAQNDGLFLVFFSNLAFLFYPFLYQLPSLIFFRFASRGGGGSYNGR